ncbi:carboxypeptidase M32 [Pirellulimonas nuda]|uniref:carboxypeptidase M32 n=1 Tax=Pirellulimonas nuda TaxID=2528009 RepID=UPI001E387BB2|nr:carboxypeptidase M32 [Pirellulimonas nuda]
MTTRSNDPGSNSPDTMAPLSPPNAAYKALVHHTRQTALLSSTLDLLGWDERTYMPPAGGPHRAEQSAFLAGLIHQRQTAPEVGAWLEELAESDLAADPYSDAGCNIARLRHDFEKQSRLPQRLVEELARAASLGEQVWQEARKSDDFSQFQPLLERTIALKREQAQAYGYEDSPYDPLLDDFEPGETTANITRVLAELRDRLAPLVAKIAESPRAPKQGILSREWPTAAQERFGKMAAGEVGFDFSAGRLDTTAHPFCGGGGPRDVRLTTRYQAHDFADAFFSTLHEAGHGLYEQGLPAEHFGLPIGEALSLGIHESQSRMWENLVGRSSAFWRHMLPKLRAEFPQAAGDLSAEAFYFAVNESRPSLIRTESDEATYNLHIIVRFELEQALLNGDLKGADLPEAWNQKYRDYLGVASPTDADGCLQDVHWSAGLLGYFPTYTLGNLYACQFMEQARRDLGDLDAQFESGEFGPLLDWLRTNVHAHGRRYTAGELVERVSGGPLSCEPLMRHLETKFGALYGF